MERHDRRAMLLLVGLAVLGHGVRVWATAPGEAPGGVTVLPEVAPRGALAHRDSARRALAPLQPGEQVDVDRADAQELERLPRVGPALARRIVAWRAEHGAFGGVARLDSVPGVGPGLLAELAPWLAFSGGPARMDSAPAPLPPMGRMPHVVPIFPGSSPAPGR
ncbi:MAG: helix-hairpin-helix domain-containing protein [Gemmatimonadales bacterium]|nr:helix-hairpin-helix domain-containing protein [Gemmatimonadales bacterium]